MEGLQHDCNVGQEKENFPTLVVFYLCHPSLSWQMKAARNSLSLMFKMCVRIVIGHM